MTGTAVEGVRDGDLAEILRNFGRFWGDPDLPRASLPRASLPRASLPRALHHPMFFLEFRDTAFVAHDLGTGEIAGYLLGFVAPAGDGYIHFIAVRDDFRTLGLGRTLYAAFEQAARDRGAVALKAITSPGNEGSVAFHKRVGFTEMVRVDDYGGGGRARIVMRKPLS